MFDLTHIMYIHISCILPRPTSIITSSAFALATDRQPNSPV